MQKNKKLLVLCSFLAFSTITFGCKNNPSNIDSSSNKKDNQSTSEKSEVEDYYTINLSSVQSELLVGKSITIEPAFKNLGDVVNPNYKVVVYNETGADVTNDVYNKETKEFSSTVVGTYSIEITVLNDKGEKLITPSGLSFSKKTTIDVVIQNFEPINSSGNDVSVSTLNDVAKVTFGESYSTTSELLDSGQYKVTGLIFEGSYSITYSLENVCYSPTYSDPAFYFGWTRNDSEGHDDCFKLSSGDGSIATWQWDSSNGLADLSKNKDHGWYLNVWYNAPDSVSGFSPISGDHTITFDRFVNNGQAIYGIKYDNKAFTYLDIGKNYTEALKNVWVESNNTSASISVSEYKEELVDTEAPEVTFSYQSCYQNETVLLDDGLFVEDNSGYGSVLPVEYEVKSPTGLDVDIEDNSFVAEEIGDYIVNVTVSDFMGNITTKQATISSLENTSKIELSLEDTSSVARTNTGMIIYASAKENDLDVEYTLSCKVGENFEEAVDCTENILSKVNSKDSSLSYDVFTANANDTYWLSISYNDEIKTKKIVATASQTSIYGYTLFDSNFANIIIGNGEVIYSGSTSKIGMNVPLTTNWTLSFDVTDLSYSTQGKLIYTLGTSSASASWGGWEDLAIGGKPNSDLWGYETSTIGTGWVTYQWRSTWQSPVTTAFLPDPNDKTKGCGRDASAYSQYGQGTHSYKIVCSTNDENVVTYSFYIDGELEVVHKLASQHNGLNSCDFFQISSENMSGIVTNIRFE